MTHDPRAIAEGLTAIQRRALIALCDRGSSPHGYYARDLGVSGNALTALLHKHLAGGVCDGRSPPVTSYRALPLGREVRAILQERQS